MLPINPHFWLDAIEHPIIIIIMQSDTLPETIFSTPKRKRSDCSISTQPSPSRLKLSGLPARPVNRNGLAGEVSLQTAVVALHLQNLELGEKAFFPQFDIQKGLEGSMIPHHERHNMNPDSKDPISIPASERADPPTITHESLSKVQFEDAISPNQRPEVPETPLVKPVLSPSPLPSRTKSPPLPSSALWWKDTEITGHDPKDPMDDGYGINGVGFLPTLAIANARAERRKRQVAEWRNREAREARQRRSDRRRRGEVASEGSGAINPGLVGREVKKVRFLET